MATSLPHFERFDATNDPQRAARWESWLSSLQFLFDALDLTTSTVTGNNETQARITNENHKIQKRKRGMLLHYAGTEVQAIFKTFDANKVGEAHDFDKAVQSLTTYFNPDINAEFCRYKFRSIRQNVNETVDEFHTRLRQALPGCNFQDAEVKSQIIQGCSSIKLRRKSLENRLDLQTLLDTARTFESVDSQLQEMNRSTNSENIRAVSYRQSSPSEHAKPRPHNNQKYERKCWFCGESYPHKGICPAKGTVCESCGKQNHFAKVCRSTETRSKGSNSKYKKHKNKSSQSVRQLVNSHSEEEMESDVEFLFTVTDKNPRQPYTTLKIDNQLVKKLLVDTGATVNVLDENAYN